MTFHYLPTKNFKRCMSCGRLREDIIWFCDTIIKSESIWKKVPDRCVIRRDKQ